MPTPGPKYRELANWYVQLTPGAIFRPVETAGEMLRNLAAVRDRFPRAECGVIVSTIERATGQLVSMDVYPMQDDGTLKIPARLVPANRAEVLQPFTESLARVQAIRNASATPITAGVQ